MSPSIRLASLADRRIVFDIDDDATHRYAEGGLPIVLADDHPFAVAERARWSVSIELGRSFLAELDGKPVGVAVLGLLDGRPYLDQLSVRRVAQGRGVGTALLERAMAWADGAPLFLTTYGHLSWNAPFYARRGFERVAPPDWGPEMRAVIESQRAALPAPEERVVMRYGPRR